MKTLLFSLTEKDFDFHYFTVGGNGGGGKDTSNTGVRCVHRASGSTAICVDTRSQRKNKEKAFERCCKTNLFNIWHKTEVSRRLGTFVDVDALVDKAMESQNLKIETY